MVDTEYLVDYYMITAVSNCPG